MLALKPFGCCCFPWLRPYTSNKLEPRSTPCIFLGYCSGTKGYRCLDPIAHRVYISRHVKFIEHDFPYHTLLSNAQLASSVSTSSPPVPHFVIRSTFPTSVASLSTSIPTSPPVS